jgi:LacI family transcriptional regulator
MPRHLRIGFDFDCASSVIRHIWTTAPGAPITCQEVAAEAGMSRRTLDRRMTAALGRTASQEVARVRQQRIAVLLQETDWPIKRIALEMGFRSPEELARFFRHRTGRSPSAFRKTASA